MLQEPSRSRQLRHCGHAAPVGSGTHLADASANYAVRVCVCWAGGLVAVFAGAGLSLKQVVVMPYQAMKSWLGKEAASVDVL